jgi:hypothetical protein
MGYMFIVLTIIIHVIILVIIHVRSQVSVYDDVTIYP